MSEQIDPNLMPLVRWIIGGLVIVLILEIVLESVV
jgi:hypothetical protein